MSTLNIEVEAVLYIFPRKSKLSLLLPLAMTHAGCLLQPAKIHCVCMTLCDDTHMIYLQLADSSSPATVVVKIVKISPAAAPCRSPDSQHTVSILDSSGEAKISFSAVYQPCNLLERPKVYGHLHPLCSSCCARDVHVRSHMRTSFSNEEICMWTGVSPGRVGIFAGT